MTKFEQKEQEVCKKKQKKTTKPLYVLCQKLEFAGSSFVLLSTGFLKRYVETEKVCVCRFGALE